MDDASTSQTNVRDLESRSSCTKHYACCGLWKIQKLSWRDSSPFWVFPLHNTSRCVQRTTTPRALEQDGVVSESSANSPRNHKCLEADATSCHQGLSVVIPTQIITVLQEKWIHILSAIPHLLLQRPKPERGTNIMSNTVTGKTFGC